MKALLPLLAAAATAVLIALLLRTRAARWALDHPNDRSLHTRPRPRIGGVAMLIVLTPLLAYLNSAALALPVAALSLLSFLDDRYCLPVGLRFAAHALAAAVFVYLSPAMPPAATLCAVLALMWMANLYNFMDGSDGLAGGMTLIGFACYALAAAAAGHETLALSAACVSCAAAAFLYCNFPPAKIFLGDVGSIPLGFLAAALGLDGWQAGAWPWWFPLLVFAPFIFDASLTLLRRICRLERIWQAHRSHYYQRLIQSGWSHRRTALAAYGLMLGSGLSGIALLRASAGTQINVLLLFALFYMVVTCLIDRASRPKQKE